ncbi:hypothetical protein [Streptomyces sp. NBC_01565]|uniref:hypothetical protein n=1 Tax=Streptomyces sp. NBC_01565 TaxID=2975881 RepID=UPI0022552B0D|nr:hypothetical protein [Streptomyces sp. NBC_01565]MCX4543752.1 helix-turn-helix domain-containing protein [Streptomyces sp. NBC_01565]
MNTTAAATEAKVTVATIRHWARRGVIAATKTAGRWVIDTASLARRIAIGARRTRKTIAFTVETLTAIGGSRWQRGDMDRIYFNNPAQLAGLETSHYKTGNISGAHWQGELISNSQAYKLATSIDKLWYDLADGKFHCRYGFSESREASPLEVFHAAVAGIRTAIAAL